MFKPKPLKGNLDSYEPIIPSEIMDLHYNKHYLGYLKKLNDALLPHAPLFKYEVPKLLSMINEIPEEIRTVIRNNGGGVINHEILWETLSEENPSTIHDGPLKEAIEKRFGSWENFVTKFIDLSGKLFGSGWIWLTINNSTRLLNIMSTSNQDSPFMYGRYPLFGVDVWEHAYYLKYHSERIQYVTRMFDVIDWKAVEKRFLEF